MCAAPIHVQPAFRDSLANMGRVRFLGDLKTVLVNWSFRLRRRANCCGDQPSLVPAICSPR